MTLPPTTDGGQRLRHGVPRSAAAARSIDDVRRTAAPAPYEAPDEANAT